MENPTPDLPVQNAETYLDDGVYVKFDGWQIILRTPRENGDHTIALEPSTYKALHDWLDRFPRLKIHMT